ncbi:RskA family anti-sigma factor [Nocardia altamirensis]|uniref:RskA family anti-sigma factor n=1 Tax=Nocardia altamirensis TaxID=472158 RepID=UPI0008407154|nr:hypothetical protein [Nocardia altamirensis]
MNERQVDLAHTVALGSIDDVDRHEVQELLDTEDPALRTGFRSEVQRTEDALATLAELTATPPPAGLRTRLLAAIAADN